MKSKTNFSTYSIQGLLAALLFGYFTYKLFPVLQDADEVYDYFTSDDLIANLISSNLQSATDGKIGSFLNFIYFWFWAVFISYLIKTITAIKHIFNPSIGTIYVISWTAVILEVLPIFIKIWSISSFEDGLKIMLIVYIPTLIGIALLFSKKYFD
jgi:hypothetical protein